MRQLDLFGSFLETSSPEDNSEEKEVVSKKEEKGAKPAEASTPSYSKNSLRSERLVAQQPTPATVDETLKETSNNDTATSSPTAPLLLSLFDAPLELKEPAVAAHEQQIEEPTQIEAAIQLQVEESIEEITVIEPSEPSIEIEPEAATFDEEPKASTVVLMDERVEEKKITAPKQKKQVLPELQRNGSVIFDDGKITVKLKSTSPFPAPIAKPKREKVKKPLQKRGRKSFKEIDAEVDLIEIPEDETLFQKQYYPISEVARWFRVNTSLLRFWENEFDVLKPRKNRKGDRLFRPEDVKNLQLIYQLLRQRKYTIEGAKEYIKTNKKKADIQLHLTNTLQKFKSFLLDLKANLQP